MYDIHDLDDNSAGFQINGNVSEVYPVDRRERPPEKITKIVGETLEEELNSQNFERPEQLLGRCNKNAVALLHKLHSAGYSPTLCVGVIPSLGNENGLVDAFENVKNVHQWVEVNGYIVEICTEATPHSGNVYISERTPSNYQLYTELSYSEFSKLNVESINSNNIQSVCEQIF